MPLQKGHITYREWRERGETVLGAFFRTVPYQYIWTVLALLVALAAMGVLSIKDLQL